MKFRDTAADGETKASPFDLTANEPLERLEDFVAVGLGDPRSVVGNAKLGSVICLRHRHLDYGSGFLAISDGVGHKVLKQLDEKLAVTE